MQFTEQQISIVAKSLSDSAALACGVNKDDTWKIYSEQYIEEATSALEKLSAAAPKVVADADGQAYTAEEAREEFLAQVRHLVSHWERESREPTVKGKLEGLAFSIMNIFDGTSDLPAFDIVCAPHPDDKQYCIDEGSKYFAPGMVINDCHLHEMLFHGRAAAPVPSNSPELHGIAAAPVQAQEPVNITAFLDEQKEFAKSRDGDWWRGYGAALHWVGKELSDKQEKAE